MIKERRYETYGGKDGTIDMENKKSKRINTKIRGGRGRCRCCRDHFNSGRNIYLISICILCIYKRIITKDYYSIYKYLYYCIYCYKPYKNRYNNIYIIPLKDN